MLIRIETTDFPTLSSSVNFYSFFVSFECACVVILPIFKLSVLTL